MRLLSIAVLFLLLHCGSKSETRTDPGPNLHDPADSYEDENKVVGDLKGYAAINDTISLRLGGPDKDFILGYYLANSYVSTAFLPDLIKLLGAYDSSSTMPGYRNTKPNSVNVLLWDVMLTTLATDLMQACSPEFETFKNFFLQPNEQTVAVLTDLCAWPMRPEQNAKVLSKLWDLMIASDAPLTEKTAWIEFVQSEYGDSDMSDSFVPIITTAALNPYFLLKD